MYSIVYAGIIADPVDAVGFSPISMCASQEDIIL